MGLKYQEGLVEVFLYNMKMLIPVWREIGMGKIPHSSLMAHSHIPHLRLSSHSFNTSADLSSEIWECASRDS